MSRVINKPTKRRRTRNRHHIGFRIAALHRDGTVIRTRKGKLFRACHDKGAGDQVLAYWTETMEGVL